MARRKKIPGVDPAYLEKQRELLLRKAKSALFREAIMTKILSELEENHPTLF